MPKIIKLPSDLDENDMNHIAWCVEDAIEGAIEEINLRRQARLKELIRMCNTPVSKYLHRISG